MKKLLGLLGLLPLAALAVGPLYYEKSDVPPAHAYYVKGYGAKCNGTTDDTTAIQTAATAVTTAGGGILMFPTGNCKISNTITVGTGTTLSGYGTTLTPITPRASWAGTVNNQTFVVAASAADVKILGFKLAYDSTYNSGACHVIDIPSTASRVLIKDNTSTYCGDFSANIGATDVTVTNNRAYTVYNACFDSWSGATNVIITNNICSVSGTGSRGIEFTGLTTALTAATSSNVIITGNIITLLGSAEQGINVDGLTSSCAGNAAEKYGTIADNHIFMAPATSGWGILLRFCANYWDVHDNVIFSDGTDMAAAAIAANSDSNSVLIHNNVVYNWNNQTSGAERGLFRNGSVGGSLVFNECFSCTTATTLVGATDATTLQFANDTGSGALTGTFGALTISPGTSVSQASWGTAGIALIGTAFTANDTTTGSGGVNSDVGYGFGAPTFTNTQGTANVLTNAVTMRIPPPVCGSGWASCTNLFSLITTGRTALNLGADLSGASVNINASNNFGVNINTGTSAATTTIGNSLSTFTLSAATINGTSWAALPAITATSVTTPGQLTSSVVTGTAPLVVASTTNVSNLNASLLNGTTFAAPAAIGSGTPAAGTFTTLTASGATNINASANNATNINTGTSTGTVTIGQNAAAPSAIVLAGPVSFQAGTAYTGASWTTTSPVWNGVAMTLNDTTASGTVATEVAASHQAPNFTSTGGASTTITHAVNLYVAAPTCSGGVVCTNLESINTPGKVVVTGGAALNGTININASNSAVTSIGTGSTASNVSIGNGANLVVLGPTEINTGTKFTLGNFSGCSGTNGTPTTLAGGPQGGSFVTASNGTTCSVVITINGATGKTAATGWACWGSDITTAVVLAQSASSTTTCTLKGTINAVGDTVIFMAMGY